MDSNLLKERNMETVTGRASENKRKKEKETKTKI